MNKILQIVGAVALSGAVALGFVGCGGSSTKYSDEEYYAKLVSASQYVPNKDYTITMNMTTAMPASSAGTEITMGTFGTSLVYTYNDTDNKYYTSNKTTEASGEQSSVSQEENWVQQSGDNFVSYTKSQELVNDVVQGEPTYSAQYVSSDHAKVGGALKATGEVTDYVSVSDTFEEFKEAMDDTFAAILEQFNIEGKMDSDMKFSTKKDVHSLKITANLDTTISSQAVAVDLSYVIEYTDKMVKDAEMGATVTMGGETMMSMVTNVSMSDEFDSSLYQNCPTSEFANVEISDNYSVYYNFSINNTAEYGYDGTFNANLLDTLNNSFCFETFDLLDGVNIEWYYDKDYTRAVGAEDLMKSYTNNYYAKITPKAGYAVIVYGGHNNDVVILNTMGEYDLSLENYTCTMNGQEVTKINVEDGQVYLVETEDKLIQNA